jgi:hypothetical protein
VVGIADFDDGGIPEVESFALETAVTERQTHLGLERIVGRFGGVGLEGFLRCVRLKGGGNGGGENEARQRESG